MHRDSNNIGPSAIVLLGEFTGGRFEMVDAGELVDASETGAAMIIDGTRPHRSLPFDGKRISIVAFLHKATSELSATRQRYLRRLGFAIPRGGPKTASESNACSAKPKLANAAGEDASSTTSDNATDGIRCSSQLVSAICPRGRRARG